MIKCFKNSLKYFISFFFFFFYLLAIDLVSFHLSQNIYFLCEFVCQSAGKNHSGYFNLENLVLTILNLIQGFI